VNLAGNAVKFTGQGGVRVTVGCTCEADGMGRMQFAISDTGIGIAADKIEELFQPFVQADASSTRYYGGTGLGLTISRRLAKALGGDIEVTSQAGKGSTFTLTIDAGPMKGVRWLQSLQAARPPEPPLPDDPQPSLHGRVLFAEDVPGVQVLIAFLLKRMNLEVDLAGDGRAVCAMAEKSQAEGRPYDLIFMDIQMPEMNGYEATRRLRQQGWQGPIVALTAHAMVGDREKCLAAGCDDYLSKPVSPQGLREVLARYIPARDAATVTCRVEPPDAQATPHTSIERLRERFINGLPERAQVLEDAWRAGNRLALAQAAHQLKGTAGAYGLSRVAQAAQTVELLVTGESIPPETAPAMAELLRLCVQARSEPCGAAGHE
jgi:CheY-like chemotaxis protein